MLIGEAEALLAGGDPNAAAGLQSEVARNPQWVEGQSALAALKWELGDQDHYADDFSAAVRAYPHNASLWNAYIQLLQGVGSYGAAAEAAALAQRYFHNPVLQLIEASNRGMMGDDDRVEMILNDVPPIPDRDNIEVRHHVRRHDYDRAKSILDRMIQRPHVALDTFALAEILWRATADARWQWLAGSPQFIVKVKLSYTPSQLDELANVLRALHRQRRAPVGQSVRGGTQTRGRLLDRRDPVIRLLRESLQSAVDAYREQLPPWDGAHPLLKHRKLRLLVDGGWSVRLTKGGFHVPHLHPAGVLSSAFHVHIPQIEDDTQEGYLELGRPPDDLRMQLAPLAMVRPESGCLVLFPSFLYHGTRRFGAGERLSVAFDVCSL